MKFEPGGAVPLLLCLVSVFRYVMSQCSSNRLVLYQVTMETHWSKVNFPKDYPKFRPPAQWSKVVGRTHNGDFSLYRLGSFASGGLKKFAESGNSDVIDGLSQGRTGVCDAFTGAPISEGVGTTESQFFADGNHSKVSLLAKIIPSPDWFVGVDSIDLCSGIGGEWLEWLRLDVDAIDAGSDNGYTFTAPKWPSVPQEAIHQITSTHRSHPAASFFYPNITRLPPIATFTFTKLKEYLLWPSSSLTSNDVNIPPLPSAKDLKDLEKRHRTESDEQELQQSPPIKRRKSRKIKGRGDCVVSKWTQWSDCTSKTCDLSEQYRTRSVLTHPRLGALPCPPLLEKKICVPDKGCQSNLFDW